MTEIILYLWVITAGDIALTQIDGWLSMEECETAVESFLADNPGEVSGISVGMLGMCKEVPK